MLVAPTSRLAVDDLLDLILGELRGHEFLEDRELRLLGLGAILPATGAECVRRLDARRLRSR
jgi:hypothetical protein